MTYHGSKRQKVPDNMGSYDIVLTTYDTLRFDLIGEAPVLGQEWARVILDEGICTYVSNTVLHMMHTDAKFP